MYQEGMQEFIESLLPEGWYTDIDTYGVFDFTLYCPHGNQLEMDGTGPCGCVSPLRDLGLI